MENWLIVLLVGIGILALILVLSLSSGSIVVAAANRFYKKQEKKVAQAVLEGLPKNDCGQCGCSSCSTYGREWASAHENPGRCPFVTEELTEKIRTLQAEQDAFVEERISTRPKK